MSSKESNNSFSECIPQHVLVAYLKNELRGVERNAVERHVELCPLCADTLEGLSNLENPEEIFAIEKDINSSIDRLIEQKDNKQFGFRSLLQIAASIAIVFAISVLVYYTTTLRPIVGPTISERILPEYEKEFDLEELAEEETIIEPPISRQEIEESLVVKDDVKETVKMEMLEEDMVVSSSRRMSSQPVVLSSAPKRAADSFQVVDELEDFEIAIAAEEIDEINDTKIVVLYDTEEEISEEEVFIMVEEMPVFPGGDKYDDFQEYVAKNLVYPEEVAENGIQGRVFVQFVVEADGSVSNVSVIRSIHETLDKEAVRVIENSPRWKPGMQRGRPVRVSYMFPVYFKLEQ